MQVGNRLGARIESPDEGIPLVLNGQGCAEVLAVMSAGASAPQMRSTRALFDESANPTHATPPTRTFEESTRPLPQACPKVHDANQNSQEELPSGQQWVTGCTCRAGLSVRPTRRPRSSRCGQVRPPYLIRRDGRA
jgi:hypothetical protein